MYFFPVTPACFMQRRQLGGSCPGAPTCKSSWWDVNAAVVLWGRASPWRRLHCSALRQKANESPLGLYFSCFLIRRVTNVHFWESYCNTSLWFLFSGRKSHFLTLFLTLKTHLQIVTRNRRARCQGVIG